MLGDERMKIERKEKFKMGKENDVVRLKKRCDDQSITRWITRRRKKENRKEGKL